MEIAKLTATNRSSQGSTLAALSNGAIGKGPARRLRKDGLIPAIAYGQKKDALPLAVAPKALKAVLLSEHGRNSVIELSVEGGETFNLMLPVSVERNVKPALPALREIPVGFAWPDEDYTFDGHLFPLTSSRARQTQLLPTLHVPY